MDSKYCDGHIMPDVAKKKFLEGLKSSNVFSAEELQTCIADVVHLDSADSVAKHFVESGKLTGWQAKYLLGGRTRLRFGNYVLTERLGRSDLGDSFIGTHVKLARKVKLLFLSNDHSKKLSGDETLIRELAATTDVDHPNLEQVHLIDQDSGRFMFVTQYLDGSNLSEPTLLARLKPAQIPTLMRQAFTGLSAAHASGLFHGSLTDKSFFVTGDDKLKIEGFLKSNLGSKLSGGQPATAANDLAAIKQITKRLVKRFDTSETRTLQAELDKIQDSADLEKIANKKLPSTPAAAAVKVPPAESHQQKALRFPKKAQASESTSSRQNSGWMQNLLWASAGIMAATILFLFGPKLLGWNAQTSQAKSDSVSQSDELPSLPPKLEQEPQSIAESPSISSNSFPEKSNVEEPIGLANSGGDLPDEINLESVQNEEVSIGADLREEPGSLPTQPDQENEAEPKRRSSLLDKFKATSDDPTVVVEAKEKSPANSAPSTPVASDAAPQPPAAASAPATEVPATFPTSVDLPPNSISEPLALINFGEKIVNALSLELICSENVSKRADIRFELSGERNRSWDVSLIDSTSKTKVGKFAWADNQLNFSWLTAATENLQTNYLRNCILRVNDGVSDKWLPLRKPVIIPGFVLERDKPRLKVEIENLEYLPKGAIAQLHELDSEKYGQIFFADEVNDQSFSRKKPLRLVFSEIPEYQMVMLTLNAEIKNKSKLEALLQVRLAPDKKRRLADDKTMSAAKQFLEQYIVDVTNNYETLKNMKVDDLRKQLNMTKEQLPNTDKKAREKQLKEEIEIAKQRAEIFRTSQTQLESFYNSPIPVTIYFQAGDQRIVLASTLSDSAY